MTELNRRMTVSEVEESTPMGRREMSVARLSLRAALLISRAFQASGMSQKELAGELGITEGRVSQVLNGDGNFRVSTIARFLAALGYDAVLEAHPTREELPSITGKRRLRNANRSLKESVYVQLVGGSGGSILPRFTVVPEGASPSGKSLSAHVFVGTLDHQKSVVNWTAGAMPSFAIEGER